MFVYRRFATVNYSRTNFSIVSVTDLSTPEVYPVSLEDYMLALSSVVPGFNASVDVKGDNSQLATYAVTALPISDSQVAKKISLKAIRKAMSVPLDYFQANYFAPGPNIWELDEPREGLADDMYTELSIAILSHQVVAGRVSRWLFIASAGVLLLISAAGIAAT
ncbi:putative major facilitator superfamily transporter [Diplodia seriata]|nr:putative major facilitator superfamily transporter [Diplodia seriata]